MVDAETFQQLILDGDHQGAGGTERQVIDQQMRFEMDILVIDLPEVQVMSLVDGRMGFQGLLGLRQIDVDRHAQQKNPHRITQ